MESDKDITDAIRKTFIDMMDKPSKVFMNKIKMNIPSSLDYNDKSILIEFEEIKKKLQKEIK